MGKEEANIILRNKREMEVGIVCECCINRCNSHELQQYCASSSSRRRRSLKSIVAGVSQPPTIFTEEIVDKIYEEIAEDKYTDTDSQQETVKLQIIEENKRENIILSITGKEELTQQQKIPYNSDRVSFASGHDSDSSSRDTGKLISKSLIANKRVHRHHKMTQRKHHKTKVGQYTRP